jgi:hypothetical protein
MPRTCTVCTHPQSVEITKAIGKGVSLRQVAARFGFKHHATIQRHRMLCMGIKSAAPVALATVQKSSRNAADDADPLDPQALLRRASRLMDDVQGIVDRARASGDDRLGLTAQRELRESLRLAMQAIGMLSDGAQVVIDQRRVELKANVASLTVEELRSLAGQVAIIDQEPS